MTKLLFEELSDDWSYVCLVIIHGFLQDIVYWKEKKRYKVDQDIDQLTKLKGVPSGIMYLLVW